MTGTDAAGTDPDASHRAVPDRFDFLQVRIPDPAGLVVGMADIITKARTFAAYFANF